LQNLPNPSPRQSAAAGWPPLARFVAAEAQLAQRAAKRPFTAFVYEFVRFGVKQAWACLFGGAMLALLVGTYVWYPRGVALARYDFIFLAAVAIQIAMLAWKLETFDEAKVILIYHVVGTVMEVFKTDVGSWIYPEASFSVSKACRCSPALCMHRSAATSPVPGGCSISASRAIHHYGPSTSSRWRSMLIFSLTITSSICATCCSRQPCCYSAVLGSIIASITFIGACHCYSACSS
jgi:hypothetical protein